MISIGRIVYNKGKPTYPKKAGYKNIVVMMKSHSKWWPLSPYYLATKEGYIIENYWQFSKVYPTLPYSSQVYSRYDPTVIWEWKEDKHLVDDKITSTYYEWRKAGYNNKYAVRYPVGYNHRGTVVFSLDKEGNRLNYVEAREKIYLTAYVEAVEKEDQFWELVDMIRDGTNILIAEVDGPHQESLPHYREKYGVEEDWISNNCIEASNENIEIMMGDTRHSFGHGYALAYALLKNV